MKRKKIAMVLATEPFWGGGHQYALEIAESLQELPVSEYEVVAICMNRFWSKWCKENHIRYFKINEVYHEQKQIIRNTQHPICSRIYNTYTTEFGRLVRQERIDVLFVTAQIYIPNVRARMIVPVHDLMHRYESSFSEVRATYQEREVKFMFQSKCADYILTDSKLGRKQFMESYLQKCRRRPHLVVLPYTVPEHIANRREQYLEVPERYVFYPAQFWKHKNHINLIKAVHLLKKDLYDIHLILVGSEKNNGREIKKYISENGLESDVTILGFVSDEEITYLYRHAVGMIMPSYFGPTNIPPLEAMALGCPVAVSNKYAMPEQIGDAGLLFDPDSPQEIAECIRKLWQSEELRNEMIIRGYHRISVWTKEDFRNRVFKVIENATRKDIKHLCGRPD